MGEVMKRLILWPVLLLIPILFITGCFNGQVHIKINQNGTADIEYKMGFDESISGLVGNEPLAKWKKEAEIEGYKVEDYQEGSTVGVKAFKHCKSIKELQQLLSSSKVTGLGENKSETVNFRIEPGFLEDTYHFEALVDLTQMKMNDGELGLNLAILARINFKYILTLPVKPVSSNAGTVSDDGRTLEWIVVPGQKNIIRAEARIINIRHLASLIIGSLLVIGFLLLLCLLKTKNNQKQVIDQGTES